MVGGWGGKHKPSQVGGVGGWVGGGREVCGWGGREVGGWGVSREGGG